MCLVAESAILLEYFFSLWPPRLEFLKKGDSGTMSFHLSSSLASYMPSQRLPPVCSDFFFFFLFLCFCFFLFLSSCSLFFILKKPFSYKMTLWFVLSFLAENLQFGSAWAQNWTEPIVAEACLLRAMIQIWVWLLYLFHALSEASSLGKNFSRLLYCTRLCQNC